MTIDIRVRVWSGKDPFAAAFEKQHHHRDAADRAPTDPSPAALARSSHVLQAAVVTGWRIDRMGVQVAAEQIARWVNDAPAHRVGFAGIDPTADGAADDVDAAHALGMVGLTVAPADCNVRPTDDRFLLVAERASKLGMPVLVANPCLTTAQSVLEFARPALLDEACRALPNLSLVLGDLGAGFTEEALALCAKHPRVFAELSGVIAKPWHLYTTLLTAFERGLTDKLLFASGFPAELPERAIERMYTVNAVRNGTQLPGIPRETVRGIVERDSLRLLGIEHVGAVHKAPATGATTKQADQPRIDAR